MKANVSTGPIATHIVARLTTLFTAFVLTIVFVTCVSTQTIIASTEGVTPATTDKHLEASNPVDLSQFPNKTYLPILINRQRSTAIWDLGK